MTNLNQLFGQYNYVILFLQLEDANCGHWICFFINSDDELHYFDSYGYSPLKIIATLKNKWGQNLNLLNLIKKSRFRNKFFYNSFDYQSDTSSVCGRYCCVIVILNMMRKSFNCVSFNQYMKRMKKLTNKSFDFIVCEFCSQV